jgi:hypothetical protein
MFDEEFYRRNVYITIRWGKYINHDVGGPRIIRRDIQYRKYEDISMGYHGLQ